MTTRSDITGELIRQGVIAVIRMADPEKLLKVVDALAQGGLTAVEITLTTPDAIDKIGEVTRRFGDSLLLGVGSVLAPDEANAAMDAGARYVVSPIFRNSIVAAAHARETPAIPGAFTPTEIQNAIDAGADIVKIFPANIVGMDFFKAVLAPMPRSLLMPTGGVTLSNAADWIRAGACSVGIGSALMDTEAISTGAFGIITEKARSLRVSIMEARS